MEEKKLTMRDLPESERPYEKLERFGAGRLTDAELLAVILRSGTRKERAVDLAVRLLVEAGGPEGSELRSLMALSLPELSSMNGLGRVKALQLKAVEEIGRRLKQEPVLTSFQAKSSEQVAEAYMEPMMALPTEVVKVLCLNHQNRLILEKDISTGTDHAAFFNPRLILKTALEQHSSRIILLHNHPGGDPDPSENDLAATRNLVQSAGLMDIQVLDHIILGDRRYYSMKEEGLIESMQGSAAAQKELLC